MERVCTRGMTSTLGPGAWLASLRRKDAAKTTALLQAVQGSSVVWTPAYTSMILDGAYATTGTNSKFPLAAFIEGLHQLDAMTPPRFGFATNAALGFLLFSVGHESRTDAVSERLSEAARMLGAGSTPGSAAWVMTASEGALYAAVSAGQASDAVTQPLRQLFAQVPRYAGVVDRRRREVLAYLTSQLALTERFGEELAPLQHLQDGHVFPSTDQLFRDTRFAGMSAAAQRLMRAELIARYSRIGAVVPGSSDTEPGYPAGQPTLAMLRAEVDDLARNRVVITDDAIAKMVHYYPTEDALAPLEGNDYETATQRFYRRMFGAEFVLPITVLENTALLTIALPRDMEASSPGEERWHTFPHHASVTREELAAAALARVHRDFGQDRTQVIARDVDEGEGAAGDEIDLLSESEEEEEEEDGEREPDEDMNDIADSGEAEDEGEGEDEDDIGDDNNCAICGVADTAAGHVFIGCDRCERWYHQDCVIPQVADAELDNGAEWICERPGCYAPLVVEVVDLRPRARAPAPMTMTAEEQGQPQSAPAPTPVARGADEPQPEAGTHADADAAQALALRGEAMERRAAEIHRRRLFNGYSTLKMMYPSKAKKSGMTYIGLANLLHFVDTANLQELMPPEYYKMLQARVQQVQQRTLTANEALTQMAAKFPMGGAKTFELTPLVQRAAKYVADHNLAPVVTAVDLSHTQRRTATVGASVAAMHNVFSGADSRDAPVEPTQVDAFRAAAHIIGDAAAARQLDTATTNADLYAWLRRWYCEYVSEASGMEVEAQDWRRAGYGNVTVAGHRLNVFDNDAITFLVVESNRRRLSAGAVAGAGAAGTAVGGPPSPRSAAAMEAFIHRLEPTYSPTFAAMLATLSAAERAALYDALAQQRDALDQLSEEDVQRDRRRFQLDNKQRFGIEGGPSTSSGEWTTVDYQRADAAAAYQKVMAAYDNILTLVRYSAMVRAFGCQGL